MFHGFQSGWAALHYASKAGHLHVVKMLADGGASTVLETKDNKTPICYAASANHTKVLTYLMHQHHDTVGLMEDQKVITIGVVCAASWHDYKLCNLCN